LLDAEVYDYAFSPQKGEGFKLAIHSHMDQPIMALSDIDLSPGDNHIIFLLKSCCNFLFTHFLH
jgi:hypothetical protein